MRQKKKMFIQIPCLNEAGTLPEVIAGLPREIEGVDDIYTLVIDDGSEDQTFETARSLGVDYIVRNPRNLGLAMSFSRGIEAAVYLGADIIVTTDGDNQYDGSDIPRLVRPILDKGADVVVGCRDIDGQSHFSLSKKFFHTTGSRVVRIISGTDVPDTTSGFRAMSKEAAMKFFFMTSFSYTLEMLIQAGLTGLKVVSIPIRTNPKTRESRLCKSTVHFIFNQIKTMLLAYIFYRPFQFFGILSLFFFGLSVILSTRLLGYMYFAGQGLSKYKEGTGMLLLFTLFSTVFLLAAGLLGAVLSGLRSLLIDVRVRIRQSDLIQNIAPPDIEIIRSPEPFLWKNAGRRGRIGD